MEVHRVAAVGFDRSAQAYARGRPSYPAEAVQWLARQLGLGPGSVVVDLAAGTGKLTRELVRTGAHVVAVEPVTAMRAELVRSCPLAEVRAGVAEALPLPSASADALTVAQAFHWFDGQRALAEIHRVLRPSGRLALVWNLRDLRQPLQAALEALLNRHRGSTPTHRSGRWRDAIVGTGFFRLVGTHRVRHLQRLDVDGLVDRVASTSFIAALPDIQREKLLREVRVLAGERGGEVGLEYETEVLVYARARVRSRAEEEHSMSTSGIDERWATDLS